MGKTHIADVLEPKPPEPKLKSKSNQSFFRWLENSSIPTIWRNNGRWWVGQIGKVRCQGPWRPHRSNVHPKSDPERSTGQRCWPSTKLRSSKIALQNVKILKRLVTRFPLRFTYLPIRHVVLWYQSISEPKPSCACLGPSHPLCEVLWPLLSWSMLQSPLFQSCLQHFSFQSLRPLKDYPLCWPPKHPKGTWAQERKWFGQLRSKPPMGSTYAASNFHSLGQNHIHLGPDDSPCQIHHEFHPLTI